jgi:hypothetical protein
MFNTMQMAARLAKKAHKPKRILQKPEEGHEEVDCFLTSHSLPRSEEIGASISGQAQKDWV